jgi:acyl-CoA reductase-like NAD-dependent aldehyde dehydrogenase
MNAILLSPSFSVPKISFQKSLPRGGYHVSRRNVSYFNSINATTQKPIEKFVVDDEKSIADKASLARTAQEQWSFLPLHTRKQHLSQLKSHFQTHLSELATLLTNENGKPISQSKSTFITTDFIRIITTTTTTNNNNNLCIFAIY